jgi:uncharacterized protein YggE
MSLILWCIHLGINKALKMKISLIAATMLLISISSYAQQVAEPTIQNRTIEVVAFASADVIPNVINVSFVMKEAHENGKIVTIEQSIEKMKSVLKTMSYKPDNILVANVYGFQNLNEKNETYFEHKVQFSLRLNSIEDVHKFLHKIEKNSIESFNIDEMYYENSHEIMQDLQKKAYANAKLKATEFLKIYNEECGKVLKIEEISGNITSPEIIGSGSSVKTITNANGISSSTSTVRSKAIKIEYLARVLFEIK